MAGTDRTILRMAAIAAVIAELAQQGEDVSLVARQPGLAWSQESVTPWNKVREVAL